MHPNIEIKAIEAVFKQFGDVKEVAQEGKEQQAQLEGEVGGREVAARFFHGTNW